MINGSKGMDFEAMVILPSQHGSTRLLHITANGSVNFS